MKSLDLRRAPPRSPRKESRGLCMLPRMIDIARGNLPGGHPGEYQIGRGLSGSILASFGLDAAEFLKLVGSANDEEALTAQMWERGRADDHLALGHRLSRLTVADVPAELRSEFEKLYGADLPSDRLVFDVLETDDQITFRFPEGMSTS